MIQLTDKHWAVELTLLGDEFKNIQVLPADNRWQVPYLKYAYRSIYHSNNFKKDFYCSEEYPLETGSWQYLFTTKGCTEEQAASVVQLISNGKISGRPQYRRYDHDLIKDMPAKCWTRDSRHSLETLLLSKGCDISKNFVILKLNDNEPHQIFYSCSHLLLPTTFRLIQWWE